MDSIRLKGLQEANFIYIQGLQCYEKIITYEAWIDDIEIVEVKNICYSAHNVSNALSKAMQKDIGSKISHVLSDQPFHIERIAFDKTNATRQLTMIGQNSLVIKNGSFAEEKFLRKLVRDLNQNLDMLSSHDLSRNPMYQPILHAFMGMMDGTISRDELRQVCSVVPQDVYLEILSVLSGLAGFSYFPEKFHEESKEKVKRLLEYSK